MRFKNITGRRYGSLVVLSVVEGSVPRRWLCQCDCGKTCEVLSRRFSQPPKNFHCGCRLRWCPTPMLGRKFGVLTVIEYVGSRLYHGHWCNHWLCRCICGELIVHPTQKLTSRRWAVRSCRKRCCTPDRWTPEDDALLGTNYDRVIARRIERTLLAVQQRRLKLGIPSFTSRHKGQGLDRLSREAIPKFLREEE